MDEIVTIEKVKLSSISFTNALNSIINIFGI